MKLLVTDVVMFNNEYYQFVYTNDEEKLSFIIWNLQKANL